MTERMFLQVLDLSVTGSVVIAAVLLLRLLLKKQPKLLSYLLWAVVLLRLLVPWSPEAPWGILTTPQTGSQYTLSNDTITFAASASAMAEHVGDALNGGLEIYQIPLQGGEAWVPAYWWEVWLLFGRYVWAAGTLILLLLGGISALRLRRCLMGAVPLREPHWTDSAVDPKDTGVWLADSIETPFVVGLFRPRIFLPSNLGEEERDCILLHERHHIRRGDHWWRLLGYLALCLHWFNPLVWLAFRLSGEDMEMSCDEAVLRGKDDGVRRSYSASLLNLSTGNRTVSPLSPGFGETCVARRIRRILQGGKPARLWVILSGLLLVLSCGLLLTNAKPKPAALVGTDFCVSQVVYDVELGPAQRETALRVTLSPKEGLCFNPGASLGMPEPYPLTLSELKDYTAYDKGWLTAYRMGEITEAYFLQVEDSGFWLLFRTKDGHTFLGSGWEDLSERGQGASDDTSLRILYRLEPAE